ncbi:MAG: hypothetical protein KK478_20680 [Ensifer alkalisoli]|nr:hypothetical protein [Sinorhizobium alkalisoli]
MLVLRPSSLRRERRPAVFNSFRDYPIHPDELVILEEVLDRALRERNLAIGSEEADQLARKVIELYQAGIRDPEKIWEMIRTV